MRRAVRVAVLAAAGVLTLAFAGSALAAYTPRLNILHVPPRLGGSSVTLLEFSTDRTDEGTAKLTIYSPAGYSVTTNQAPGTQLGTAEATVQARAVSQDVFLPVEGNIVAASFANFAGLPTTTACIGSRTPQNVWVLVLTASGRTLQVPVYVFAVAGPETAFASLKLEVCLPPPDVPEASDGAAFGAKVVDALLTFNAGVFTTPASPGTYIWVTYATPYTNFRPPANALGTIQTRAVVPLPVALTTSVTYNRKTKRAVVSGRLTIAGQRGAGIQVDIYSAASPAALTQKVTSEEGRPTARATVRGNGSFSRSFKIKRRTYFQVVVIVVEPFDQEGCALPLSASPGPGGCTATINILILGRVVNTRPRR